VIEVHQRPRAPAIVGNHGVESVYDAANRLRVNDLHNAGLRVGKLAKRGKLIPAVRRDFKRAIAIYE
jgi:hypothetical protein